jgi:uncharacterized protein YllA (UPF0747 family)
MQDMLLPTAAYVAGPGELAYYAQIAPAYAWAGVEMPLVMPRASVSLADNATLRLIQQRSLTLDDLARRPEQLFAAEVQRCMPPDIHGAFERSRVELNNIADGLARVATGVDSTLGRTAEAARTRILKQADRLLAKIDRAERRKHEELRRRLAHAQGLLFPAGGLQERTVSPLYFAARFGMEFFSRLTEHISLDTTEHQMFAASEV